MTTQLMESVGRHKLSVGIDPAECLKIIEENFKAAYKAGIRLGHQNYDCTFTIISVLTYIDVRSGYFRAKIFSFSLSAASF